MAVGSWSSIPSEVTKMVKATIDFNLAKFLFVALNFSRVPVLQRRPLMVLQEPSPRYSPSSFLSMACGSLSSLFQFSLYSHNLSPTASWFSLGFPSNSWLWDILFSQILPPGLVPSLFFYIFLFSTLWDTTLCLLLLSCQLPLIFLRTLSLS